MRYLCLAILLLAAPGWAADDLSAKVLALVNELRADANERELALHGSLVLPRLPLEYDPALAYSAHWWCNALSGSGILEHGWTVNERGYLTNTPRRAKRVWLPQQAGWTDFVIRAHYLGLPGHTGYGEVGIALDRLTPEKAVALWAGHGWHDDPRLAKFHYGTLIHPGWTHAGAGSAGWNGATKSMFVDFGKLDF
jgi:hypothetical protein